MFKMSDVWKCFTKSKQDAKTVKCDICMREFAYHGTTTNLRNHLQRFHSDQYKTVDSRQTKLLSISKKCSKSRADNIDQLLLSVIVKDIRPICVVEGESMKALLQYLVPGYELPSRKRIMKLLHA